MNRFICSLLHRRFHRPVEGAFFIGWHYMCDKCGRTWYEEDGE